MIWLELTILLAAIAYVTLSMLAISTRLSMLPENATAGQVLGEILFVISLRVWF